MRTYVVGAVVGVLLLSGCDDRSEASSGVGEGLGRAPSVDASPSSSPSAPAAKDELVAALNKTQHGTYSYAVRGALPEKQRVEASGSFDPRAKKFKTTVKTLGGKNPSTLQRIVIGNDMYDKQAGSNVWAHLDMKRIKKYDYLRVDMTDPTGLGIFIKAVVTARSSGPHTYQGTFETTPADSDEFLPIGAPSIVVFGGSGDYTATTDAQGQVSRIDITLTAKETLKMTTTFNGMGQPPAISKPKRTGEVDSFYYE